MYGKKGHGRILLFGVVSFFFAGLGQTYIVAQFNEPLIKSTHLTNIQLSFLYSLATGLSSFCLPLVGGLLDKLYIRSVSLVAGFLLAFSFFLLSQSLAPLALFLSFFLLRASGQMTLALSASTTITKVFQENRGKALSLAMQGRALAEGLLPLLCVALLTHMSYQNSLRVMALIILIFFIPSSYIFGRHASKKVVRACPELLKKRNDLIQEQNKIKELRAEEKAKKKKREKRKKEGKERIFLKDPIIFFMHLAGMVMPFVVTGLIYQQASLVAIKGWEQNMQAKGFMFFALFHVMASLLIGLLIDRFSASKLLPLIPLPLLCSFYFLFLDTFLPPSWECYCYFAFLGISVGFSGNLRSNYWMETYGPEKLATLQGHDGIFIVWGSALAPFIFALILKAFGTGSEYFVIPFMISCFGFMLYFILSYAEKIFFVKKL